MTICPITYSLQKDNGAGQLVDITSADTELWSVLDGATTTATTADGAFNLVTTASQQIPEVATIDYDIWITVVDTAFNTVASKNVLVSVVICRDELITTDGRTIDSTIDILDADETIDISALFSSSDATDCPASTKALYYSSDTAPENATAIPVDISDNFFLTGDTLTLSAIDPGNYTFYIAGESVSGAYIYQTALFEARCGPNSYTIADSGTDKVFFEIKNQASNIVFLPEAAVQALFTGSGSPNCPISTYEVLHQLNSTAPVDGEELYSRLNLGARSTDAIELDTTYDGSTVESLIYNF
jgi:hypothetical protein